MDKKRSSIVKHLLILTIFGVLAQGATLIEDHDIHISICEIDFRKATPRLTIKTYLDDLQAAVGLEPGTDLPIGYTSSDELITEYVHKSIQLYNQERQLSYKIESIDASTEAVWIVCELEVDLPLSQIEIKNTFLIEVYDDQTNLVKVISNNGRMTKSMDGGKTELIVEVK